MFRVLRSAGCRYLVITPMPGFAEAQSLQTMVQDALRRYPQRLLLRNAGSDPGFKVTRSGASDGLVS